MRNEKSHAIVAPSTFPSENVQNTRVGPLLVHAVVARSTFGSASEHIWKFRCRKSAHHCHAKHIFKPNVGKTDCLRPLLEVDMLKTCTLLRHKRISNSRAQKSDRYGALFDVHMSSCLASARDRAPCQK